MLRAWRAVTGGHQSVFAAHGADKVASADLVAKLVATEDGPWSEVNHGRFHDRNPLNTFPRRYAEVLYSRGFTIAYGGGTFGFEFAQSSHPD